jgi:REP element-mobilizing transposase RayT
MVSRGVLASFMPRKARIDAPGGLHHIIGRGIEKRKIFRTDSDRDDFLERVATALLDSQTPCFAWALLPNHFHLLLRTGNASIAQLMSRILSGYAGSFNRRYHRAGHLFQNRYKSILCQEDAYFLELVRYIHLNPLRANLISTMDDLDQYAYSGHSTVMGHCNHAWQKTDEVLSRFGGNARAAKRAYRSFVEKGIPLGKRPELTGGGLMRRVGGGGEIKALRRAKDHCKGDERILGDSDFVESVLAIQREHLERRYAVQAQGYDFESVVARVGDMLGLEAETFTAPSKQRRRAQARALVCYLATRELGMTGVSVARLVGITRPAVTRAAYRGEEMAKERELNLVAPLD